MKQLLRQGFTLIEVIITIAIAGIFVISITQVYITQTQLSSITASYNRADLLAYNNLRTYAYGRTPSWFQCVYVSSTPQPMTLISLTSPVDGLPSPVIQTVVATAPYGCGGSSTSIGYPIKVQSSVTFGAQGKTVVHATYSTY
jgi:prepilin-type N-terminal cleavage/methylation domain-containing protein